MLIIWYSGKAYNRQWNIPQKLIKFYANEKSYNLLNFLENKVLSNFRARLQLC